MSALEDEEDWQEMPIIRGDGSKTQNLQDDEDLKRYHWRPAPERIDLNESTNQKKAKPKSKQAANDDYTRIELDEDAEGDEVHMRTQFLFDEQQDMTPLSQMQATKNLLSEGQKVAYVGLCRLVTREIIRQYSVLRAKELEPAVKSTTDWANKIMGRLYLHMDIIASEQRMIERLSEHGVTAPDLVPSLVTTHIVPNPEYDASRSRSSSVVSSSSEEPVDHETSAWASDLTPRKESFSRARRRSHTKEELAEDNLIQALPSTLPGVSTKLTAKDATVTLDIRWTVLCDLFLMLIADSVYDARSRVLLGLIATQLGLSWDDVIRFERRLTEALQVQEGATELEQEDIMSTRDKSTRRKRIMMMAAAGVGGGLVIGLSAGLLAPFIGAGIGATLGLVGITGTTSFLAGTGGAAVITTTGVLAGGRIASKGMGRRTASVKTFEVLPLHNNKRVSCMITVPGFMSGKNDDVRLPFSVMDPVIGDVFSVLWEPETILQTGDALKILTGEILTQAGQQILAATVMTALMGALQLPIMLTKLGYLIDNPWSNALDRARQAGQVLADVLIQRHLGVRPITLVGFSLGARAVFYCLLELARTKNFGIVQDVYLLGATVTATKKQWREVRGVVAGRLVNAYAQNDWILGYLFRATTGGLWTVAGLRPVEDVPNIENVDITGVLSGHMSYRSKMPLILKFLGFKVTNDHFDEPDDDDAERPDREILTEQEVERRRQVHDKKASKWKWMKRKKNAKEAPNPFQLAELQRTLPKGSYADSGIGSAPVSKLAATSTSNKEDMLKADLEISVSEEKEEQPLPVYTEAEESDGDEAEDAPVTTESVTRDPTLFNTDQIRAEIEALRREAQTSAAYAPAFQTDASDMPSWTTAPSVEIAVDQDDFEEDANTPTWAHNAHTPSFSSMINPFASSQEAASSDVSPPSESPPIVSPSSTHAIKPTSSNPWE